LDFLQKYLYDIKVILVGTLGAGGGQKVVKIPNSFQNRRKNKIKIKEKQEFLHKFGF